MRPNSIVNRVLYDEKKSRATGVEIIDAETKEVIEFYASVIFLNAATLGTTFILLNSISSRFPNGLGNGSDRNAEHEESYDKECQFTHWAFLST